MTVFKTTSVCTTTALRLQLACLLDSPCAHAVVLVPRLSPATRFEVVRQLRGGQDDASEEEEEEEDLDDLTPDAGVVDGDEALENPFLSGAASEAGAPIDGLADTLQDPSLVREALKELQDPAAQARMRAMMEDPEFQKSMQQYVEQISKDPQFEQPRRTVRMPRLTRPDECGTHRSRGPPACSGQFLGALGRLGAKARPRRHSYA